MLIKDSNSKVALHALNSLESILPTVKQQLTGSSVNLLIQNTAAGLASKNRDIYDKASSLLDSFINNIGEWEIRQHCLMTGHTLYLIMFCVRKRRAIVY